MKTEKVTTKMINGETFRIPLININKELAKTCLEVMDDFDEGLEHKRKETVDEYPVYAFCGEEFPTPNSTAHINCFVPDMRTCTSENQTRCIFLSKKATIKLLEEIIKEEE